MRQVDVDVKGAACFEQKPFAGEVKLDPGIGLDGDMNADQPVLIIERIIGVFANEGTRREPEQTDRPQRAGK